MDRGMGVLMDEIEKSLWNLTEDNLCCLCEHLGQNGKGMDHRSLRRKIMEEMWGKMDSIKSELGMSWLLQLEEDIRRIQMDGSTASMTQKQADGDEEYGKNDKKCLHSNGLELIPSQSDHNCDGEVRDCLDIDEVTVSSPEGITPESRAEGHHQYPRQSRLPQSPGCTSPGRALQLGLKRVSVRLVNCIETAGQDMHKQSHFCAECQKSFISRDVLERHHVFHTSMKKINTCSECGNVFSTFSSLKRHLRCHTGEKPYACPCCGKKFNDSGNLRRHIRTNHPGEVSLERFYPEPCLHCGEKFCTKKALEEHLVTHTGEKPYLCTVCGKGFTELSSFKRHQIIHTKERPFVCPHCGKSFNDSGNMTKHIRRHQGEKVKDNGVCPELCLLCGEKLPTKRGLKEHLLTHHGEKPYTCPVCRKSFAFHPSLIKHQKLRHSTRRKVKRHECLTCGKVFNRSISLKEHQRTHTGEKPYLCSDCGNSFSFLSSMKRHQAIHSAGNRKIHFCLVCGKCFTDSWYLRKHQECHSAESHHCADCGKAFSSLLSLRNHCYKLHRLNRDQFQCPACKRNFVTEERLRVHKRTHSGEKPHRCCDCGKSFSFLSSMQKHQAIHSAGSKKHICSVCGKGFSDSWYFRKHQELHSAESHHCAECGKAFSSLFSLRNHCYQLHRLKRDQYQCLECMRHFATKQRLRLHQRTHTGEKPFRCLLCNKCFSHSNSYQRHLRMHSGVKPFICTCGKRFNDSSNFQRHVRGHKEKK